MSSFFKVFSFFVLTLVVGLLFAPSGLSVLKSESAVLDVSLNLPISFKVSPEGRFSYLDVDFVMIPVEDSRQQIFSRGFNINPVSLEKNVASFRITEPVDTTIVAKYGLKTTVDFSSISEKVSFPIQNLDSSLYNYVLETEVYDINNDINNLAVALSEGEDDLFKVVFYLANWVNTNVEYDLRTVSAQQLPSSWVFENRRGVCTEYSSLLISLLRSLGIPSREVSGFAYTESELFSQGWEFHSWVEVFFPGFGWVPFDPTYGQYGFVDAGHVQLGLTYEGAPRMNSFSWRSVGVDVVPGQTELNVDVVRLSGSWDSSRLDVSSSFLEDEVGIGSYNLLKVDLYNDNPYYVAENIRLSGVQGLSFLSPRTKAVVLSPFESKSVYFVLRVNRDLERGFVYTFPVRFYINNEAFSNTFKASRGSSVIVEEDVSMFLEEKSFSSNPISCNITSVSRLGDFLELHCASLPHEGVLCFDETCAHFRDDESLFLNVSVSSPGFFTKNVVFKSSDETWTTFVKFLVLDDTILDLSSTIYSKNLVPSQTGFINISMRKVSSSVPRNISLNIIHSYFEESFFIDEINDEFIFRYAFPSKNLKKGFNDVLLEVTYFDDLGKEYVVEENIIINVEGLSFIDEIDFFLRKIYFWFENLW